ncbi:MAG: helix-turn-helix transcriptional regulator [Ruminococcaceae bacterium]|nr:helix-turn-helix transcriptional regulator [Oscillospiraceae bacterium]
MINLGNKIRELRKKKGITQEQLASVLNISAQAVSKWEMNTGYPDMNLIPIIAGYFEVSLDVLFDYDITQIQSKVEDILSEGRSYFWGNFEKAEEIYLNGIASYPGALQLKAALLTLYECHMRNNNRMELSKKAIPLAEKLISEATDLYTVADAKDSLASIYKMCDRYDDAKRVINSMPEI